MDGCWRYDIEELGTGMAAVAQGGWTSVFVAEGLNLGKEFDTWWIHSYCTMRMESHYIMLPSTYAWRLVYVVWNSLYVTLLGILFGVDPFCSPSAVRFLLLSYWKSQLLRIFGMGGQRKAWYGSSAFRYFWHSFSSSFQRCLRSWFTSWYLSWPRNLLWSIMLW